MPSIFDAVDVAAKLPDIQFPEFTAKLITDTFDALVSANLRQTESYIELVGAVSKTLTTYINDTKDDISGAEILEFLATVLPDDSAKGTKVAEGSTLTNTEVATLATALTVPGETAPTVTASTPLTQLEVDTITGLVARRLAANKYALLQEMVKMGILRLVVEKGVIETRLTFSTYVSSFYQKNSSSYNSKDFTISAQAKTGKAISKWVKASASTKFTSVSVRTSNESQRDISGSSVNIFGRVEITFKTDYQPLSQ